MRKTVKCILSMICIMAFLFTSTVALYGNTREMQYASLKRVLSNIKVAYSEEGGMIVEKSEFVDIDNYKVNMYRTVEKDGTGKLIVKKGEHKVAYKLHNQDYEVFKRLLMSDSNTMTYGGVIGKDIVGSQFKKILISDTTQDIFNSGIKQVKINGVNALVTIIVGIISMPVGVAASIASTLIGSIMTLSPYRVSLRQRFYEVRLSYDDSYYVHLYKTVATSYDVYGNILDVTAYYNQVIGG